MVELDFAKDYFVTKNGEIFSSKRGNIKKLSTNVDRKANNYVRVNIVCSDGIKRKYLVHRLVAHVFIPNPDNLPEVNHKDGNKLNNSVDNLEWVTRKDNIKHAHALKLRDNTGEGNPRVILSDQEVLDIYNSCLDGARVCDLADKYGVSRPTISDIKAKRNWLHILEDLPEIKHSKKQKSLSESTVRWVCQHLELGYKIKDIINMSRNKTLSESAIYDIKRKRSFTYISKDYDF